MSISSEKPNVPDNANLKWIRDFPPAESKMNWT